MRMLVPAGVSSWDLYGLLEIHRAKVNKGSHATEVAASAHGALLEPRNRKCSKQRQERNRLAGSSRAAQAPVDPVSPSGDRDRFCCCCDCTTRGCAFATGGEEAADGGDAGWSFASSALSEARALRMQSVGDTPDIVARKCLQWLT